MMLARRTISFVVALGMMGSTSCRGAADEPPVLKNDSPVDARELSFANQELRRLFDRFDQFARETAGDDWKRTPYRNNIPRNRGAWYQAEWSRHDRGLFSSPNYFIRVSTGTRPLTGDLVRNRVVGVSVVRLPVDGWGARCDFSTDGPPETDTLELRFYQCCDGGACQEALQLSSSYCGTSIVFGDSQYRFGTSSPVIRGEQSIRSYLRSEESFRDAALAEQAGLEAKIRQLHADGKLIHLVAPADWDPRSGLPPQWGPNQKREPLTDEQNLELLRTASAIVSGRQSLIQSHYRKMYAAAIAAMPLLECLNDAKRPKESPSPD